MKTVRTVRQIIEKEEGLSLSPKFQKGDYCQIYFGQDEGHCFTVKDVRFNHDNQAFEYLGLFGLYGDWKPEKMVVKAR